MSEFDARWGSYLPWFLRGQGHAVSGNLNVFFSRISQRLERLIQYNEVGIQNITHFGAWLESESLQRFRFDREKALAEQIAGFFSPTSLTRLADNLCWNDPEEVELRELEKTKTFADLGAVFSQINTKSPAKKKTIKDASQNIEERLAEIRGKVSSTRPVRASRHYSGLVAGRLTVLEALLRILPKQNSWFPMLVKDIQRAMAEASVPLDLRGDPPLLMPLDEPLLQSEVIDAAFRRLQAKYPERAKELTKVYHDLLAGEKLDSVFSEAFKTLEETARSLTGCSNFLFDKKNLNQYFPNLHGTIHETIIRFAGHRGDRAGHARSSPDMYEIRYLLFAVCNLTILLLDYYDSMDF